MAEYLEWWLRYIQSQASPRTYERYAQICRQNIIPEIGATILTKLRPTHITDLYSKALLSGRRDGREDGLSARSVLHVHRVLKQALSQAVRLQMLSRNPADAVKPPKPEGGEVTTYNIEQTAQLRLGAGSRQDRTAEDPLP